MTRFDCMVGSSAGQRAASTQALHHCAHRSAFGKRLDQQPLMRNVLADLALEYEGSLALTMRVARAMDHRDDAHEDALARIATPVGKYWICKRTPNHAYEAMECIGGSGVMEDGPFPRLFRESPVNAIWEAAATSVPRRSARAPKSPELDCLWSSPARGRTATSTVPSRSPATSAIRPTRVPRTTSSTGWRSRCRRAARAACTGLRRRRLLRVRLGPRAPPVRCVRGVDCAAILRARRQE
jgi:hypothetical protein